MSLRHLLPSLALLVVSASAASGQQQPRKERNLITLQEIEQSGARDPLQAVRKLRPVWLSSRGASSLRRDPATGAAAPVTKDETMVIYVDGVRRGGLEELQAMGLEQVQEIRFLPVDQAMARFGTGHPFGAIEVVTKK